MLKFGDALALHARRAFNARNENNKIFNQKKKQLRNRYFQVHIRNQLQTNDNSSPNTTMF